MKLGPEVAKLRVRRFLLQRDRDASGISGVGFVAEGVEFSDGSAVLSWRTMGGSTTVYPGGAAQIDRIHGHGGLTVILWLDEGMDAPPEKRQFPKATMQEIGRGPDEPIGGEPGVALRARFGGQGVVVGLVIVVLLLVEILVFR